jgi:acyl dehydratase
VCGFDPTGPLPITYPHVLGFPLAMRLMAGRGFPLPVLGLVHTRIEITRHRDIRTGDRPEISVHATGPRPHRRGTEVTMVTEARLDGELVWESGSTYLSRHPRPGPAEGTTADGGPPAERRGPGARTGAAPATGGRPPRRSPADAGPAKGGAPAPGRANDGPPEDPRALTECASWQLPADLGRRYGAASGDRNPIHLYAATARAFGFPRAIAHGMWTFARCLAERNPRELRHAEAEFRAPVLLPGSVAYATGDTGTGDGVFELRGTGREGRVHLIGRTATSVRPS